MALQEVPQPELQRLSTEAKAAVALFKYMPLTAADLPHASCILQDTARLDLWPARAAALVYAQVSAPPKIYLGMLTVLAIVCMVPSSPALRASCGYAKTLPHLLLRMQ